MYKFEIIFSSYEIRHVNNPKRSINTDTGPLIYFDTLILVFLVSIFLFIFVVKLCVRWLILVIATHLDAILNISLNAFDMAMVLAFCKVARIVFSNCHANELINTIVQNKRITNYFRRVVVVVLVVFSRLVRGILMVFCCCCLCIAIKIFRRWCAINYMILYCGNNNCQTNNS